MLSMIITESQSWQRTRCGCADSSAAGSKVDGKLLKGATAELRSGMTITIGSHHTMRCLLYHALSAAMRVTNGKYAGNACSGKVC